MLDLLLWMGIPLAAVVLVLGGGVVGAPGPRVQRRRSLEPAVAVGAIGVHALTEYPLDYAYFLLTLGLLSGRWRHCAGRPMLDCAALTYLVPWAVATAMLVWVGVEYMKVEESARQVRMVLAGIGLEKRSYVPPPDTVLLDRFARVPPVLDHARPHRHVRCRVGLDARRDVAQPDAHPRCCAMR